VDVLTQIPDKARGRRRVRRLAPLAAALGVIIAATIGLVLTRVSVPEPNQPTTPTIETTAPTTH
jgi:hypothetical protein